MKDLSYTTVSTICDLWESCRLAHPNFEQEFGALVLEKLFTVIKVNERQATQDRFWKHRQALGGFVDSVIQTMGPDCAADLSGLLLQTGLELSLFAPSFLQRPSQEFALSNDASSSLLRLTDGSSIFTYLGDAMILVAEAVLQRDLDLQEQTAFDEVYFIITQEIQTAMADTYDDGDDIQNNGEACPGAMQASLNSFNSSFGSLGSFAS